MFFLIILFVGLVIIGAFLNLSMFFLVGIFLVFIGVYMAILHLKDLNHFKNNGFEVEATIVDIKVEKRDNHKKHRNGIDEKYKVFITYAISGKERKVELNYYSSSMKIGDTVLIYVDNINHDEFVYAGIGPVVVTIILSAMGMVFALFSFREMLF